MKNYKILSIVLIICVYSINYAQDSTGNNFIIENYYSTIDSTKDSNIEKEMSISEYLSLIKEIVTIIGLALGIFWGFPILKKKLQEDHIKKLVDETQQSNKSIREECHKLIEKHSTKPYKNRRVDYKELQDIYLEIRNIDLKASDTSKEISSLVYLLKNTLQGVLRHYDPAKTSLLTSTGLYNFYLSILSDIIFFATKVVTLPKKASTTKFRLINRSIEKFLTDNTFDKYKYFEIGLDIKVASPVTFLFFSRVNNYSEYLFQRAAYQIIINPAPITRLLYLQEIYLPVIGLDYGSLIAVRASRHCCAAPWWGLWGGAGLFLKPPGLSPGVGGALGAGRGRPRRPRRCGPRIRRGSAGR